VNNRAGRFWAFSLRVYGRPGVAEACLALQDRHGVDVNLLLWCAWAGTEGIALDRAALDRAVAATAPWRDAVVRPLRTVRRALKEDLGSIPAGESVDFRARIKAAELEAERRQQVVLEAMIPAVGGSEPASTVNDNIQLYLKDFGSVPSHLTTELMSASMASIGGESLGGGAEWG